MSRSDLPLWAKVAGILLVPLLTAGIAWGVGQARLESLDARLSKVEEDVRENTRSRIQVAESLRGIQDLLRELRTDVRALREKR